MGDSYSSPSQLIEKSKASNNLVRMIPTDLLLYKLSFILGLNLTKFINLHLGMY